MTKNETIAANYFRTLVESFIAHPKALNVTAREGNDWVTVRASCDSRDFGRIVGSGGKTFKLLSMLMELAGKKAGNKFTLQRLPNTHGEREFIKPTPYKKDWNSADTKKAEAILGQILEGILDGDFTITTRGNENQTFFLINIDDSEPLPIQHEDLILALSWIMNAIGQNIGREIRVEKA